MRQDEGLLVVGRGGWLARGLLASAFATVSLLASMAVPVVASASEGSPPTIESESASHITSADATLNATVDPQGLYIAYEFQIDTSSSYNFPRPACPFDLPGYAACELMITGEPLPAGLKEPQPSSIPAGSSAQSVSVDLASIGATLQPGTTYHFRMIAANTSNGETVYGADQTFTTPPAGVPPTIDSESVSSITSTDATLEAQINPNGNQTTYEVFLESPSCLSYGIGYCESSGGELIAEGTISAGSADQTVSVDIAGTGHHLLASTMYGYRVVAKSSAGTKYGGEKTFTTPPAPAAAPVIDSVSLSHLTPTDATLEATINTEGLPTTYEFLMRYEECAICEDLEPKFGVPLPSGLLNGSFVDQRVSLDLNSAGVTLRSGPAYEYSVRATNAAGSTEAKWQRFVDPSGGVFEPAGTTTSTPSGASRPAGPSGGDQPTGPGSSSSSYSAPGVTPFGSPLGKTTTLKPLTNAQKLSKALKACERKPKRQRASCKTHARKQYGASAKKANSKK